LLVVDRAGVGVGVGIDGMLVHVGALSLPEARSWEVVPEDGDGVEESNKDGVTLGDLTEDVSIWAKGTDSGG